jgi:hypothetical protein
MNRIDYLGMYNAPILSTHAYLPIVILQVSSSSGQ